MLLPDPFRQFPELPARQRIDAGARLVEHEKCWIMDEGATKPELLPHAAREAVSYTHLDVYKRQTEAIQRGFPR